jgi:hypothetical protein
MSEAQRDIENIEAWAEVIGDILFHVPAWHRAAVLALATKNEEAEQQERAKHGGIRVLCLSELNVDKPGMRHWNAIMRLKSLLVQIFVRDISNDHSEQDAARILYSRQPYGNGSGELLDYLPRRKWFKQAGSARTSTAPKSGTAPKVVQ